MGWLAIPIADLPGSTNTKKRGNLSMAMKSRKFRIRKRILGAHIWFPVVEVVLSAPTAR